MTNSQIKDTIIAVLLVAVLGLAYMQFAKGPKENILPAEEATKLALAFINENLLQGRAEASLVGKTIEDKGVYKFQIEVGGQTFASYVTKDGEVFFPEGISVTAVTGDSQEVSETGEGVALEGFTKCLSEKGMRFYGASWCSWCKKQKELFGEAAKDLPYVECVDEKTNELSTLCKEAGITGFPTWQLPDGTKSSGFKSLEELSKLSGCALE